jgi:hypothetical protein
VSSAASHHCTCPEAIRTENRRQILKSIWRSREWRDVSHAYKARHPPVCSRCGKVGLIVPGHSGEDYSHGEMATYIQKVQNDQVVPLCHSCNKNESKGKHPCPSCIRKHVKDPDHYIQYIGQGEEMCYRCENPIKKKQMITPRHICGNRHGVQRCLRDGRVFICTRSSKTAPGCDHFVVRKKREVQA